MIPSRLFFYPPSFKMEDKMKTFSDKQILGELNTTDPH